MVSSLYLSTIAALVATVYGTGVATVVNKCSGNVNAQIISNDGNGAESTVSPGGTFYGNVYSTTPYNIKLWDNNGSELQLETVLSGDVVYYNLAWRSFNPDSQTLTTASVSASDGSCPGIKCAGSCTLYNQNAEPQASCGSGASLTLTLCG